MEKSLNRRDFLKLAGLLPLSLAAPRLPQTAAERKNVLVIVFDAFSAYDVSLLGYARETTPNLTRLAERAIVYHQHYAGGNYTTTGTASLLTGLNAWTHRAFRNNDEVSSPVTQNIFHAFKDYYRLGYTHNILADTFLKQFSADIEELASRDQLLLGSYGKFVQTVFGDDEDLASVGWRRNIKIRENGTAYSLFLSRIYGPLQAMMVESISQRFPRGIPTANSDDRFILEDAIEHVVKRLAAAPQPFMGYFHFLPPHAPYRTREDFFGRFNHDGYEAPQKPRNIFHQNQDRMDLIRRREEYNEFILYVDSEFGRLYDGLENEGLLDNTVVVLTSDHGEMNERGISGHSCSAMHEPVLRVPLLIFDPGRKERLDIHTRTGAIDLLPTLTQLAGVEKPAWGEGTVLPPFAEAAPDEKRSLYALRAIKTEAHQPLTDQISVALVKGKYKLHYYLGYPEMTQEGLTELVHLFDVEADPEELVDLAETHADIAAELLREVKAKIAEVNQPYL